MDLKDKDDITSISLRWLFKQAAPNAWNLNHVELTEDTHIRLGMLLSIYKGIHEISPRGQENAFFTNPNSGNFLNGLSIKGLLIKEPTTDAMDKVIVWLKSRV